MMREKDQRPGELRLLVPDSGRTWAVMYHEIDLIPPGKLQLGDVLIVHHATNEGVMFMQATHETPNGHNGWMLREVELASAEAPENQDESSYDALKRRLMEDQEDEEEE